MRDHRRPPNLVFVFADQLRARSLGYRGDPQAITPHIDSFAREALDFTNAVANSPVCTAYRATLMTGKYTTSHGMVINELRMNPNQRCLGHVLTDAGYRTGYIGKWHLYANELGNHRDPRNSFVPRGMHRLGFDGEWKAYNFNHTNYSPDAFWHGDTAEKNFYADGIYELDAQTDFAIDFIRRGAADPERPFALFLSWGPPHDPWGPDNVPVPFWRMFETERFPNPPNYSAQNDEPYCDDWARLTDGDREQLESWRRGYYAQTASLDFAFGRLLAAIAGGGALEDTVIVFTSDHGEMFGAHGRRAKNIFYEEACHVPLLVRWPGQVPAGGRSDACISAVDLMPTLLGLLGLDVPDGVEGTDLSAVVRGEETGAPEHAFMQICGATAVWEDGHEWRAIRDARFTYAQYRVDGAELLFDRQTDPYQLRNLICDPEHKATLRKLERAMHDAMRRLDDGFEASSYYRDNWTDGERRILRSATAEFGPAPDSLQ
jgi:arylsulfatase A-like enzyme